jgi:hypothetical protein
MEEKTRITPVEWLTVILGSGLLLLTTYRSGSLTPFGLSFWGPHGHDAIFHLALIESFAANLLSFDNPLIAGLSLGNYHLGFDYLLGFLVKITSIGALDWYFRLAPPLIAVSLGWLTLKLLGRWGYGLASRLTALSLVYAGGSLGQFVNLLHAGSLSGGESRFWATQAVSILINPPLALSLVLILAWVLLWFEFHSKPSAKRGLVLTLLLFAIYWTKAYAGVLLTGALFATVLSQVLIEKKLKPLGHQLWLSLGAALVVGGSVWIGTKGSSGLFIFEPLYLVKSLFASPDRLNLPTLSRAWDNYLSGGQLAKLSLLQLLALVVFFLGNFGVRVLAIFSLPWKQLDQRLMLFMAIFGIIPPLLFIQQGTAWNTIQFMYYSLFIASLLAAPVWVSIFARARNVVQLSLILLLFGVLAFPTTYGTLRDYLSDRPASVVSYEELRALSLIKNNPGTVLSPRYNQPLGRRFPAPKPLNVYESTAYISALSGAPTYLSDEVNLTIMAYDFSARGKRVARFYATDDLEFGQSFLVQEQIDWIINPTGQRPAIDVSRFGWRLTFDGGTTSVYTHSQ